MKFNKKNDDFIVYVMWHDGTVMPLAWSENKPSVKKIRSVSAIHRKEVGYVRSGWMHAMRLYDNKRDYKTQLLQL